MHLTFIRFLSISTRSASSILSLLQLLHTVQKNLHGVHTVLVLLHDVLESMLLERFNLTSTAMRECI